jgi:hypothetical protein
MGKLSFLGFRTFPIWGDRRLEAERSWSRLCDLEGGKLGRGDLGVLTVVEGEAVDFEDEWVVGPIEGGPEPVCFFGVLC